MPLSKAQIIHIKIAQRECALDDLDYRDALDSCTGCRSSKAPELGDVQFDTVMKYLEAIYWRKVDLGQLQHQAGPARRVFKHRGYWASKNAPGNTSRDRFVTQDIESDIARLEADLAQVGCGPRYTDAIYRRICGGRTVAQPSPQLLAQYKFALQRTLKAKTKTASQPAAASVSLSSHSHSNEPF